MTLTGVFFADLLTPMGVAVWIIYLVPVVLTYFVWRPVAPVAPAALATVLMLIGFILSPPGVEPLIARINRGLGVLTVWVMALVGWQFIRNKLAVRRQDRPQSGQTGLSAAMRGDLRLDQVGEHLLRFLAEYLNAPACAPSSRSKATAFAASPATPWYRGPTLPRSLARARGCSVSPSTTTAC